MSTSLKAFVVTVVLVGLCATDRAAELSPQDALRDAEAKWAMNKPKAYEFNFKLLACIVCRLTGPGQSRLNFTLKMISAI
jgi:hypothetical protein